MKPQKLISEWRRQMQLIKMQHGLNVDSESFYMENRLKALVKAIAPYLKNEPKCAMHFYKLTYYDTKGDYEHKYVATRNELNFSSHIGTHDTKNRVMIGWMEIGKKEFDDMINSEQDIVIVKKLND